MRIDVITIFPELFEGVASHSILRIAQEKKLLDLRLTELREFTEDKHRSVDDRPFGGGPGMVMKVEPLTKAVRAVQKQDSTNGRLLLMCPKGRVFDQAFAQELSTEERLILLAPRYEGYDERIFEILKPERVSIGDYVLTGGELAALVVIDAVTRLLPGVLGDDDSSKSESFADDNEGLLEYPHYTRPATYEGHEVPEVLLSGDHAKIKAWRRKKALEQTKTARPDLLKKQKQANDTGRMK